MPRSLLTPQWLRTACKNDIGEPLLRFRHGFALPFLLPVVDDFCGFVEDHDAVFVADPLFGFDLLVELFPGIIAGPKEILGQGTIALADNLVYC